MSKILYRYEEYVWHDVLSIRINEIKYEVTKETPCGYWIQRKGTITSFKKWIRKNSIRRFACLTREEALESFKARKKRQIQILENKLGFARIALKKAENMEQRRIEDEKR